MSVPNSVDHGSGTEVVGLAALSNRASRRVLEKTGMRFDADTVERARLAHWVGRWRAIV